MSVVNSDYLSSTDLISEVAVIEVFLAAVAENCTFTVTCAFQEPYECPLEWRLGAETQLVSADDTDIPQPLVNTSTGCLETPISYRIAPNFRGLKLP